MLHPRVPNTFFVHQVRAVIFSLCAVIVEAHEFSSMVKMQVWGDGCQIDGNYSIVRHVAAIRMPGRRLADSKAFGRQEGSKAALQDEKGPTTAVHSNGDGDLWWASDTGFVKVCCHN